MKSVSSGRYVRRLAVSAAVTCLSNGTVFAQPTGGRVDSIVVRPSDGSVWHVWGAAGRRDSAKLRSARLSLKAPQRVPIVVRDAVSTLYSCSATESPTDLPNAAVVREFLSTVGPLLIDPALLLPLPKDRVEFFKSQITLARDSLTQPEMNARTAAAKVRTAIQTLNQYVDALVRPARVDAQQLLQSIGRVKPDDAVKAAHAFGSELQSKPEWSPLLDCANGTCRGSKVGDAMIDAVRTGNESVAKLLATLRENGLSSSAYAQQLREVAVTAQAGLAKADELIALGFDTDALLQAIFTAAPNTRCGDDRRIEAGQATSVSVAFAPRSNAILARGATLPRSQSTVSLLPEPFVRLSLGLSMNYARTATYDIFGATTAAGSSLKRVAALGKQDARLLYGVTLGLSYSGLDHRSSSRIPWAIWLPEVFVQPAEANRALGLGVAASISVLKLGLGASWIRHTVLDGQPLDTLVLDANQVKTRVTYGRPVGHLSLSLIGWPPFLTSKK